MIIGASKTYSGNGGQQLAIADILPAETLKKWANRLKEYENDLEIVISNTENEFLYIGSKLSDYYGSAKSISHMSSSISSLISGEEVSHAIEGLNGLIEVMTLHLKASSSDTTMRINKLREITRLLDGIYDPLEEFFEINKRLSIIGLSIKIQSATIKSSGAGFNVLAQEIKQLSKAIDLKYLSIKEELKSLTEIINHTLSKLFDLESRHQAKAKFIMDNAISSLSSLTERYGLSANVSKMVASGLSEITHNIGEIVTSVQFHDITRQQFGQVRDALKKLQELIAIYLSECQKVPDSSNAAPAAIANKVFTCCENMASELGDSAERFTAAVDQIIGSLLNTSAGTAGILDYTKNLTGDDNHGKKSLLEHTLSYITSVVAAFTENNEASQELSDAINTIITATAEMSMFVEAIKEITDDIKLIALNAEVKAEQGGSATRPLSVLAGAAQQLSINVWPLMMSISGIFKTIDDATKELSSAIGASTDSRKAEIMDMHTTGEALITMLNKLNKDVGTLLEKITAEVQMLSEETRKLTEGITVHGIVEKATEKTLAGLREIVYQSRNVLESALPDGISANKEITEQKTSFKTVGAGAENPGNDVELFL